jgi:senataxin
MVAALSERLNRLDFLRIERGLKGARNELSLVDSSQRTQKLLVDKDQAGLLALYEALCCVDFHKDDQLLSVDFDYVFESIQTRKILRIGDTLPAMARFLFSKNPVRCRFAQQAWTKMPSMLSARIFDWAVLDVLTQAIIRVSIPSATGEDITIFWKGFRFLLDKMDQDLIRHSLRAMEVQPDVYRLALQHLGSKSDVAVQLILIAIRQLLQKAPKDFWSAMGTISPATVADQIFLSPGFAMMLMSPSIFEDMDESPATSWIPNFIDSIPANEKYDACRKLLDFLLSALQKGSYPESSQIGCCGAALTALHSTLTTFTSSEFKINPSTSLIVISNIMELVYTHRKSIMQCADLHGGDKVQVELKRLGVQVIRDALTLDCKAISSEYFALDNGIAIQRGHRGETQKIWESLLDIFRPGDNELAKSILPATLTLVGLDELLPENKKHPEKLPKDHVQFNSDFHQLMENVAKVFQRLSDFSPHDLSQLCTNSLTARPLFAALVSSDQGVHEATLEILKATTGQDNKRDAIQTLLESTLAEMLSSITAAVMRVSSTATFGAVPHMIKINREVLKGLCGNTGVLRTRDRFETHEKNALTSWWISQWKSLDVVFSSTEAWAPRVNKPTLYMQDFVRDCMEYAEALFNEYRIFASVLEKSSSGSGSNSSTKSCIKSVLTTVCVNVNGLVAMLRLRDGYLISVITSLLGKLLRCLGEYDLEVDESVSSFIKDACCKQEFDRGFKKTNLTNQQKAELRRALEEHQGIEFVDMSKATVVKKQGTIDAWSKSADGKQHEPKLPPKSLSHELTMHSDKHRAALEKMKTQQAAHMSQKSQDAFKEKRRKEEEERKKINLEAIARAKALRAPAATVKGEGSGLKDIGGVAGKDHAPIRSEIMVGSSDEDSDSDDLDETNTLVKRGREKSKQVKEYERMRQLQMQMPQGPVKKTKIQRSAKDLRARVEPNMDKLYLEILNWDIFHPGDTPPSNNECLKIDNRYFDLDLYKRTFAPLLISEVWRSLVTAKDEDNFKPIEIKVLNRLSVDKFMEISTTMPMSLNRDTKMSERDIVLLSKSPDPLQSPQIPHCLARVDRTTRKKDAIEVTYRISRDVNPEFLLSLVPNGKVHAIKIADMTTTQREYAALSSLEYYDLCSEVLEAKPSPIQKYSEEKIASISAKYSLNKGQAQAILSANDNDGFTLIQG